MLLDRSVIKPIVAFLCLFNFDKQHFAVLYSIYVSKIKKYLLFKTLGAIRKLLKYYLIIFNIYDIVPRAVNAYLDKIPIPQLEQINTKIKHNRINSYSNIYGTENIAIAIISQNVGSAMRFLLRKISESEVAYE